jgi:hypothetical protein
VSEGKAAHLGWVLAHPARVRRRARAARVFISHEAATAPIYSFLGGGVCTRRSAHFPSRSSGMSVVALSPRDSGVSVGGLLDEAGGDPLSPRLSLSSICWKLDRPAKRLGVCFPYLESLRTTLHTINRLFITILGSAELTPPVGLVGPPSHPTEFPPHLQRCAVPHIPPTRVKKSHQWPELRAAPVFSFFTIKCIYLFNLPGYGVLQLQIIVCCYGGASIPRSSYTKQLRAAIF